MSDVFDLPPASPPQYHDRSSTAGIMWTVTACLLPAAAWGAFVFGARALVVLGLSVAAAILAEGAASRLAGRRTLQDGSAVLAGLLIGMSMPPSVPLFIPVTAAAFAMLVVKWSFGGLGTNWMNPALAGRVFVFFSWSGSMTGWTMPRAFAGTDGVSGATPRGIVKAAQNGLTGNGTGPLALLRQEGYPISTMDTGVTEWLNSYLLGPLGINLPDGYVDLFVGNVSGSIGEVSAVLLLLGTIVLFARGIVRWQVPAVYFATFAVLTRIFGGLAYGQGFFSGDVLFATLTGGFILVLFFMATDPVTSPVTRKGMMLYGAGAGLLTFLLRTYGQFPESVALAVILMNILVPVIDRSSQPRRFGAGGRSASRGAARAGKEGRRGT